MGNYFNKNVENTFCCQAWLQRLGIEEQGPFAVSVFLGKQGSSLYLDRELCVNWPAHKLLLLI